MSTRPPVFVHLHPSHLPAGCLAGSTAVVIDVLRATTVMIHALAAGCRAIIPCLEIEEALAIHKSFPQGHAFLGGEREGRPIDGFDLGNSPADYTAEICKGRTLVMTTTNGTRAIQKCCDAEKVYVVGFVNLAAMARRLQTLLDAPEATPVHLVCAGPDADVSLEDTLLAGSLFRAISYFHGEFTTAGNDAAMLAENAAPRSFSQLADLLKAGRGGQNVQKIGLGHDIKDCSHLDRFSIVACWQRTPEPGSIQIEH